MVPEGDKQTNVYTQAEYRGRVQIVATNARAANEGDIKGILNTFVTEVHSAAANGLNDAPRPTDRHSELHRWEQGVEANRLAGIPDFVMATEYGHNPRRVTAVVEVKNPWQITPHLIDASSTVIILVCHR